jgi:hypothetical protein
MRKYENFCACMWGLGYRIKDLDSAKVMNNAGF